MRSNLVNNFDDQPCDLLIALHARKSHAAIARFAQRHPELPLIVAISGTDLYEDLPYSSEAQQSLRLATRLVVLQGKAIEKLPAHVQHKARVIYQSAVSPVGPCQTHPAYFDVCVMGHLRPVKDPLRSALAARLLPDSSRIRIVQIGTP